ncbi:T9SS type A sorting domain-containing protein [Chondrinema litorale]|uniref:T9SS type A sorting domain-containing protein n=1 Tax=Chondrinema litorale TaxID=2994555 RepID=UPI002542A747|nr:T9SS type A sorting domain-containing protein [Chondrinema litorale]UZR93777.1 T9SS type A sorting domain-containing protein [Chondrinema litorale]
MNRILFITGFLMLIVINTFAQKITEAEYFIDVDPGVGNGISIPVSSPDTTLEIPFELPVKNLSIGEHIIIIRIKDENNNWSLSNYSRFFIEDDYETPTANNLEEIEYFVDNDPGVGNGTKIQLLSESTSFTLTESFKTIGLEAGEHSLVMRTKDAEGNWSLNKYSRFFLEDYTPNILEAKKIKKVEYFIDGPDPGFENAESLSITPDYLIEVSETLLMSNDTSDLGRHAVLVRVQSEDDEWSLTGLGEYDYCSPEGVLGGFDYDKTDNTITFTDQSKYAVDYIWDMDNGDSLYAVEPEYTYTQGGTYQICQTVYSFCDTTITCKTIDFPTPRITDSIPDFSILEDNPSIVIRDDLNNVFADGDGDELTFYAYTNEDDIVATINGVELSIEGTNDYFGEVQLVVEAEGGGISAFDTILVTVLSVNDYPIAKTEFKDQLWDEDSGPRIISTRLSNVITDVEDNKLDFTFSSDTSGLIPVFHKDTLQIELAPHFHGTGTITIFATDDSLATSEFSFMIEVIPLPDSPILLKEFSDVTLYEDSEPYLLTSELSSYFAEPDSQQIYFSFTPADTAVSIEIIEDSVWISLTPDFDGEVKTIVTASDGELTTSDTFNIIILPENDAPKFSVKQTYTTCPETELEINLQNIVKDRDGFFDDIQFTLSFSESENGFLSDNDVSYEISSDKYLIFKTNTPDADIVSLKLEAKDLQNASNDTIISIKVNGASIYQEGDTLYATSGSSYQWYKGGVAISGATSNKYVPIKKDNYQVQIKNGSCTTLSSMFLVTATENPFILQNVTLYPNPAKDECAISLSGVFTGQIQYSIVDINGRSIEESSFLKSSFEVNHEIELGDLKNGFYIIILKNKNQQIVKKLYKSE